MSKPKQKTTKTTENISKNSNKNSWRCFPLGTVASLWRKSRALFRFCRYIDWWTIFWLMDAYTNILQILLPIGSLEEQSIGDTSLFAPLKTDRKDEREGERAREKKHSTFQGPLDRLEAITLVKQKKKEKEKSKQRILNCKRLLMASQSSFFLLTNCEHLLKRLESLPTSQERVFVF